MACDGVMVRVAELAGSLSDISVFQELALDALRSSSHLPQPFVATMGPLLTKYYFDTRTGRLSLAEDERAKCHQTMVRLARSVPDEMAEYLKRLAYEVPGQVLDRVSPLTAMVLWAEVQAGGHRQCVGWRLA
jgi:hypothetical protein